MHSDAFLLTPSFSVSLKCFLDNYPTISKIKKVARDKMACRWIQKWRVRIRAIRLNRTPNIRVRCELVVVENDISIRCFVLITNKRRVKILEILWDFRSDSVFSANEVNINQVQALINEFNLINCVLGESCGMQGRVIL